MHTQLCYYMYFVIRCPVNVPQFLYLLPVKIRPLNFSNNIPDPQNKIGMIENTIELKIKTWFVCIVA